MGPPNDLSASPAERVRELGRLIGPDAVVDWCGDLLVRRVPYQSPELPPLSWLGGLSAVALEARGYPEVDAYWPRVWAARGLLHGYDASAARSVVAALGDEAWRVREMAAKVVARWEVGEAADALVPLLADAVPRVRAAGVRALGVVGEGEHAEALHEVTDDPEEAVRRAAGDALDRLGVRLDREL